MIWEWDERGDMAQFKEFDQVADNVQVIVSATGSAGLTNAHKSGAALKSGL